MRVRLPQTATRPGAFVLVRALDWVTWTDEGPRFGGPALRRTQLHELADVGKSPVVLEYTEIADSERDCRGRRRWRTLLVLWRWNGGGWIELARARGDCQDSLRVLGEIAAAVTGQTDYARRSDQALRRIWGMVEHQLAELDGEWKWKALLALRDGASQRAVKHQPAAAPEPAVAWCASTPIGTLALRRFARPVAKGTAMFVSRSWPPGRPADH